MANLSNINDKFLVTTGGNVLIGQTAAVGSSILQVTGDSTFTPISTVSFIVTNSGNALRLISGVPSGVTWIGKLVEYYASEYSFSTDVTGVGGYSQQFVIETNGNVGIGETSPTTKLDIGGMADPVVRIKSGAGGDPQLRFDASQANRSARIKFYDNGSVIGGFIDYLHNGDKMNFGAGSSSTIQMTVTDGAVGIGTDSPGARIDIKGVAGSPATSGTTQNGILRIQNATNNNTLDIGQVAGSPYGTWLQAADKSDLNPIYTYPISLNPLGGNVGIGTDAPGAKLDVRGSGGGYLKFDTTGSDGTIKSDYNLKLYADDTGDNSSGFGNMQFFTAGANERMRIQSNGNVGIGTTSPGSKLMISDANNRNFYDAQFKIEGSGYTAAHYLDGTEYMIHQNSNVRRIRMMSGTSISGVLLNPGATAWSSYSDESLKENLKPLDNVLDKIKDYRCVEYNFKNDKSKGKKIGFIAQDWEEDYPQIVDKDNKGLLDMKYTETIPVLLKAIQELKAEIEILKNK